MPVSRIFPTALLLLLLLLLCLPAAPAWAGDRSRDVCLDGAEQRAIVASHKAIRLAEAIKTLHVPGRRSEVLRAELCQRGDGLVYVLTLLARNGRVSRATVDATTGALMKGH